MSTIILTSSDTYEIPRWKVLCKNNTQLLEPSDGEDDGTPLQYSCLENPMDGGAL